MTEWRAIPGYEGFYQVSDDGQVRSLDRVIDKGRYGQVFFRGVVLRTTSRDGYRTVALNRNGDQVTHLVHRLVALAFLPDGKFAGAWVLHQDGSRDNNSVSNLRWGTPSENNYDTVKHGTHTNSAKDRCPQNHPYDEANTAVCVIKGRGPQRTCRTCKRRADRIRALEKRRGIDPVTARAMVPVR